MPDMAGYSGTPLLKKLGIKPGMRLYVQGCPTDYDRLVGGLPADCELAANISGELHLMHLFSTSRSELHDFLQIARRSIRMDGMVWVSWPQKTSRVPTDITEDVIREVCLPMDLVDIKVCAVNDIWSGLKLVIRKEKRAARK